MATATKTEQSKKNKKPKPDDKGVIRTKSDGCFQWIKSPAWGTFETRVPDPLGIEYEPDLETFKLIENFPRIPAKLWQRWIALCFELCDPDNKTVDETTEVTCVFVRGGKDFREWRILVPRQEVGSVEAHASFKQFVDIETGEEIDGFPDDWHHAGSTHSHNTMPAFFSGTDDKYELDVPGIHIVVGEITELGKKRSYIPKPSIVMRRRRMENIKAEDVIDLTPEKADFHPKCLEYIKKVKREPVKKFWSASKEFTDEEVDWLRHSSDDAPSTSKDDWLAQKRMLLSRYRSRPRFEEEHRKSLHELSDEDFFLDDEDFEAKLYEKMHAEEDEDTESFIKELELPFEETESFRCLSKPLRKRFLDLRDELEAHSHGTRIAQEAMFDLLARYM